MEDDPGAADDERTIELSSIAAIYPELELDPESPFDASLTIRVSPTSPLTIRFQQLVENSAPVLPTPPTSTENDEEATAVPSNKLKAAVPAHDKLDIHRLAHLPSLNLTLHLPGGYPSTVPPDFKLTSTPAWIPRHTLQDLEKDGKRLWEELGKDQVVFSYIDHLQTQAENGFDLARDQGALSLSSEVKLALLDFDLRTKREMFKKETFYCGICLEPKKGTDCHRLILCAHVFCVGCLQDFFNNCVSEGDVDNVKCLDPGCGKEFKTVVCDKEEITPRKHKKVDRTLNPSELLQIPIEREVVQRYVRLKRKKQLESDKTTIYCPRQWCQGAARSKKHPKPVDPLNDAETLSSESEEDHVPVPAKTNKKSKPEDIPMAERLSICEDCNFAFCSVCKKGWHGEVAVCNPRRQAELNEEEKASLQYLQMHTTACPTCSAPAQKTMGCNHMICYKCKTHFCYLCSAYLMPENPYKHYNELKSTCYMRLWELEGGDGDQVDARFEGGNNWEDSDSDDNSDSSSESDLEHQDFEDFAGDDVLHFSDEDDTDDEEPAPDQRQGRDIRIEMINFARAGAAGNNRIVHNLPAHREPAPPPPAPAPPNIRGGRRGGRGRGALHLAPQQPIRQLPQQPRVARVAVPPVHPRVARANMPRRAPDENNLHGARLPIVHEDHDQHAVPEDDEDETVVEEMVRAGPAPGQGREAAQQPAPVRAMGLERFLELAQQDREDEWNSDE